MNEINQADGALRTMLKEGRPAAAFPCGVSMRPLIKQGKTFVALVPLTREPEIGDIVAFVRPRDNANIIHRIVDIRDNIYVTRGDNCLSCEYSKREQLFGLVESVTTNGRTVHMTDRSYLRYVRLLTKTWCVRKTIFQLRERYRRLRRRFADTETGQRIKGIIKK